MLRNSQRFADTNEGPQNLICVVVPAQAHGNLAWLSHGSAIGSERASGVSENLGRCHRQVQRSAITAPPPIQPRLIKIDL